jgi:hypothetical protein
MLDWNVIIQIAIGVVLSVGAYLYRDLKSQTVDVKTKADKTYEELLNYKLMASEKFVTNGALAHAVENLNRTLENVSEGIIRVEQRLNNQIDNSNHRSNNP